MQAIETLRQLLPPPAGVAAPSPRDFDIAEATLGVELPPDYRALAAEWGAFGIDGYLWLMVPAGAPSERRDIVVMSTDTRELIELSPVVSERGMRAFSGPGSLLPWAYTEGGALVAWQTEGSPTDWPVVIMERSGLEMETFSGGAAAFLVAALRGRRFCGLPEDFPGDPPELTY